MSAPPGRQPPQSTPPPPPAADVARWVTAGLLLYPLVLSGLIYRWDVPVLDAAFLAVLIALLPTFAVAQIPLVGEARIERIPAYKASALTITVLALAALTLGYRGAGWEALGLGSMGLAAWALWSSALLLAAGVVVVGLHQLRGRAGIAESPVLAELIPRTPPERRYFALLSFAAGFGEEIVFRGYALAALVPVLGGGWGAALFTSVVFGLLHAYQGPLGMMRTSVLGMLLASSLLLSGSLWPAITAHVALDLLGGLVWGDRLTG